MTPQFDVFLSHTSVDKAWVIKLKDDLIRCGVSVWLDKDEIRPGDLFAEALEKGLRESKAVALIISPTSMASGWVKNEYYRALSLATTNGLQLIPVLYKQAKIPGFLQDRNWVDFSKEDEYSANVLKLVWGITGNKPPRELDPNPSDSLAESGSPGGAIQTSISTPHASAEIYSKAPPNNGNPIPPPNRPKYYFRPILSWRTVYPQKLQELTPFITWLLKGYLLLVLLLSILIGIGTTSPESLKFIPSMMSEMGFEMTFMKMRPLLGPSFIAALISFMMLNLAKAKLLNMQVVLSILLGSSLLSVAYIFCVFILLVTDKPIWHLAALATISIVFVGLFFTHSNIRYYWAKKTLGDFTLELLIMLIFVWFMAQLFYKAIIGGTT